MKKQQTCILVLGMHRSGTSALTGTLELMDVYLGSELMGTGVQNAKGFFENRKFLAINKALLSEIGSNWDDVFYHPDILSTDTPLYQELKTLLSEEFEYSDLFAIKDPRLVYLFPIYEKALQDLDIEIKIIIPYRSPVEVAQSLLKRNKMSMEKGMLLWTYHILLAEKFSRSYPRVFTAFDQLLHQREEVIQELSDILSIDFAARYHEHKKEIDTFLEPGLKHHNVSTSEEAPRTPKIVEKIMQQEALFNTPEIHTHFNDLYDELFSYQKLFFHQEVAELPQLLKECQEQKAEANTQIHQEKRQFDTLMAEKKALQKQLQQKQQQLQALQQELSGIYTGKSWLITRPFRKLKRWLRS